MNKLEELMGLCKCGVFVRINEHESYYESVVDAIVSYTDLDMELGEEIEYEMKSRNSVIDIQCYPLTPVGSIKVVHYDLEMALGLAVSAVREVFENGAM